MRDTTLRRQSRTAVRVTAKLSPRSPWQQISVSNETPIGVQSRSVLLQCPNCGTPTVSVLGFVGDDVYAERPDDVLCLACAFEAGQRPRS